MDLTLEHLSRWRTRRGWTQDRLAESLGVSIMSVSRWECGYCYPRPCNRDRIELVTGLRVQNGVYLRVRPTD